VPLYDYVCEACRHRFEVIHGVHDHGPTTCPNCGKGPVRKGITTAAIHYKGSGWAKKERHAATVRSGTKADTDGSGGDDGSGGKDADKPTRDADKTTKDAEAGEGKTTKDAEAGEGKAPRPPAAETSGKGSPEKATGNRTAKPSPASTGD
jgi:putative FmdB family regulatory protein